jgi:putative transposase
LLHADLQASYSIIKKAIPEAFDGLEGIGLYPGSLRIKEMITWLTETITFKFIR